MPRVSISLFAHFGVQLDGVPYLAFHSDKARALLAYLVVEAGVSHRREVLAGLLWPGYPERSARQSLSQSLLSLGPLSAAPSSCDAPLLTVNRAEIQLNTDAFTADVGEFTGLLGEYQHHGHRPPELCPACVTRLERALALYTGELLAGFSVRDSPEFEEWLLACRERYRRQAVLAAAALTTWGEHMQGGDQAIAGARRWAELDPMDEQAHCALMRLAAASGHRALALAQYEACRQMLRAELGVEPEEATRALYERIRAGDSALVHTHVTTAPVAAPAGRSERRHNLPAPVDSFVGRERELQEVRGLVLDPPVRLVTLVGTGGMGKTRLALEVARSVLDGFPGGAWFVDLAPLPPVKVGATSGVEKAVGAALGVQDNASENSLVTALRERRLLLLLDNCEHVLDGVAPLAAVLLRACPDLTVMATSREPLRLAGEHLYEVLSLAVPPEDTEIGHSDTSAPAPALAYGAVRLLAERASAARYAIRIDESNVKHAVTVCRHLDGMPLAIELAAARLNALGLAELARRLDETSDPGASDGQRWALLDARRRATYPRQSALLNTLDWSYDLLDQEEQRLFDRLSVFAGSFTLQGARAMYADGQVGDTDRVPGLLAGLVDRSLIQRLPAGDGAQRYRLLETLRVYGQERLAERGETTRIAEQHAAFYLAMTRAMEPTLRANCPEMVPLLFALDDESVNLSAAIRWCLSHDRPDMAVGTACAVEFWAMYHTHLDEYAGYMRQALAQKERLEPLDQAKAWEIVGLYAFNWGHPDECGAAAHAELEAATLAEDDLWIAWGMVRVAMHARVMGDDARATEYFQRGLQLYRTCNERDHMVMTEVLLASYEPPGVRLAVAERLLPSAPNPGHAYLWQQAAFMAWNDGELQRSEAHMRTAWAGWGALGNQPMEGSTMCWLAMLRLQCGAPAHEALELHTLGTELVRRSGHLPGYIERLREHGELLYDLARLPEAVASLEDATAQASAQGVEDQLLLGLVILAMARAESGELSGALAARDAAQALDAYRDDGTQAHVLDARGRIALLCGDTAAALEALREQLELVRRVQWRVGTAPALEHLAWALSAAGELDEAAALLEHARSEREAMGMVLYPVEVPHHERAMRLVGLSQ